MATNFVARDGDKLAYPAFIVCAGILQRMGIPQRWLLRQDPRWFIYVNIWNSPPNHVVNVNTVNLFKARLDRFWANQDVKYNFTADLTGIGDRPVYEICET